VVLAKGELPREVDFVEFEVVEEGELVIDPAVVGLGLLPHELLLLSAADET
jgi:hypothetical protein